MRGRSAAIRASQYIVKRYGGEPCSREQFLSRHMKEVEEETAFGERVLRGSEGWYDGCGRPGEGCWESG